MKKKNNTKIGSLITGFGLGVFIGWYIYGFLIDKVTFLNNAIILIVSVAVFSILFVLLAYKKPTFTEYLSYATSIFIFYQFLWDFRVGDRGEIRWMMFIVALILFIINLFTGNVRLFGAKKTAKNAAGLSN